MSLAYSPTAVLCQLKFAKQLSPYDIQSLLGAWVQINSPEYKLSVLHSAVRDMPVNFTRVARHQHHHVEYRTLLLFFKCSAQFCLRGAILTRPTGTSTI
jgi:hypothetical protein